MEPPGKVELSVSSVHAMTDKIPASKSEKPALA